MKSLDEAVEKFRVLKQKLRNISQQSSKQTPTFPKSNKENLKNSQNTPNIPPSLHQAIPIKDTRLFSKQQGVAEKVVVQQKHKKEKGKEKDKEKIITIEDDAIDNKIQTQKKSHRKNNSWNFSNKDIVSESRQSDCKLNSLNNSRMSQTMVKKQLTQKEKEKTLDQINDLLERKKQVLQALQKKLGHSFLQESKCENIMARSKHSIRAPNLFQMQAEGRKRSKSKTLTIRWK